MLYELVNADILEDRFVCTMEWATEYARSQPEGTKLLLAALKDENYRLPDGLESERLVAPRQP